MQPLNKTLMAFFFSDLISVALAESTGEYLKQKGYRVSVAHRDLKLAEGVDGQLINASAKPVEGR